MLAILIGPVGSDEYESVAELKDDGFEMIHGHKNNFDARHAGFLWKLIKNKAVAEGWEIAEFQLRCRVCNRVLGKNEETDVHRKCQ